MRVYSVNLEGLSISAAKTLITVAAPSTCAIVLLEFDISQETSETSEQAAVRVNRLSSAGAGTSTSYTPVAHEVQDQGAHDGTYAVNYTVEPTTYDTDALYRASYNWLNGHAKIWTPEARIWVPPSAKVGIRLVAAPAAALTIDGTLVVGEIG